MYAGLVVIFIWVTVTRGQHYTSLRAQQLKTAQWKHENNTVLWTVFTNSIHHSPFLSPDSLMKLDDKQNHKYECFYAEFVIWYKTFATYIHHHYRVKYPNVLLTHLYIYLNLLTDISHIQASFAEAAIFISWKDTHLLSKLFNVTLEACLMSLYVLRYVCNKI